MSAINDLHRKIEVTEVREVILTSIVEVNGGGYVRSIRILGTPAVNDEYTEIVEIVLRSDTRADLEFDAPAQIF